MARFLAATTQPAWERAARGIELGGVSPDLVKNVLQDFLGGGSIA